MRGGSAELARPFGRRALGALGLGALGCRSNGQDSGPRRISYWEKWTGFEGDAADKVVRQFNEEQRRLARETPGYRPIEVERVPISRIDEKLLVAIAGGNPPDVAGFFSAGVPAYADKGALVDLTALMTGAGLTQNYYLPAYLNACEFRGRFVATPIAPSATALHYNERLFEEAGLDPSRGPSTIEELDAMAERLTRWEVTGNDGKRTVRTGYLPEVPASRKRLLQAGFLPSEPGWWQSTWGYYFGGTLLDGQRITAASKENVRAYRWIQSFSARLGVEGLLRFTSGFGQFATPQNAFLSGRVAMVMQGPWMHNFIERYVPGMRWNAAPFPVPEDRPDLRGRVLVESDVLVIPAGSRRAAEAGEFIRFMVSRQAMELLCLEQKKFTPLMVESEAFTEDHPHPKLKLFRKLAESPNAFCTPKLGVWNELRRAMMAAYDSITRMTRAPEQALLEVERRVQASVDREARLFAQRGGAR